MERSNGHEFSPLDNLSCYGLMSTWVFKVLGSQEVSFVVMSRQMLLCF